jgi:hypothetical protein
MTPVIRRHGQRSPHVVHTGYRHTSTLGGSFERSLLWQLVRTLRRRDWLMMAITLIAVVHSFLPPEFFA